MDRSRSFPYKGESHKLLSNLVKSPREILATERVAKTFERPLWLLGPNWSKDKTRYCHFHKDYEHETNKCQELKHQIEEAVKTGQLTHLAKGVTKKREKTFETQSGEKKKEEKPALEKTSILMMLMEEEGNSTNNGQGDVKDILSCIDTEEKIVIDDEYTEQKVTIGRQLPTRIKIRLQDLLRPHADVFAWTTTHITGVPRTLIIKKETCNTKHQLNVFNHTEPVKQKKRSWPQKETKLSALK
ncbi:hypothetical protein Tco_1314758 [Tanacetum coccineum]